ncbi:MAG: serine hydrolase domain-containing protein [Gemmataceae bacterium]
MIEGTCDPAFALVRDEFARNFDERGEVGASVCIIAGGRTVVDLWGGIADRRTGRRWDRNTLVLVWSATKGATALCAHILASRGRLDVDASVAVYWPEFGSAGKDAIPVRWLLDHQAGLPVVRAPLRPGELYEWPSMAARLAVQAPMWEPGTRQGYAAQTFGFLVGELVRRIDGRDLGSFFREEIAGPRDLDFWMGLPDEHHARVAPTIRPDPRPAGEPAWRFLVAAQREPDGIAGLILRNTGRRLDPHDHDSPEAYRAVLPGQGGIANARSLAGLYTPLASSDASLVDGDSLARMGRVSSASACDAVLLVGMRFGLGFMKSADNRRAGPGATDSIILGEAAFGHAGMGGSIGFADPAAGLAFGYAMNKQGRGVLLNTRGQSLVDAAYKCVGCRSDISGSWC